MVAWVKYDPNSLLIEFHFSWLIDYNVIWSLFAILRKEKKYKKNNSHCSLICMVFLHLSCYHWILSSSLGMKTVKWLAKQSHQLVAVLTVPVIVLTWKESTDTATGKMDSRFFRTFMRACCFEVCRQREQRQPLFRTICRVAKELVLTHSDGFVNQEHKAWHKLPISSWGANWTFIHFHVFFVSHLFPKRPFFLQWPLSAWQENGFWRKPPGWMGERQGMPPLWARTVIYKLACLSWHLVKDFKPARWICIWSAISLSDEQPSHERARFATER